MNGRNQSYQKSTVAVDTVHPELDRRAQHERKQSLKSEKTPSPLTLFTLSLVERLRMNGSNHSNQKSTVAVDTVHPEFDRRAQHERKRSIRTEKNTSPLILFILSAAEGLGSNGTITDLKKTTVHPEPFDTLRRALSKGGSSLAKNTFGRAATPSLSATLPLGNPKLGRESCPIPRRGLFFPCNRWYRENINKSHHLLSCCTAPTIVQVRHPSTLDSGFLRNDGFKIKTPGVKPLARRPGPRFRFPLNIRGAL